MSKVKGQSGGMYCFYKNCKNRFYKTEGSVKFFRFPLDENRCHIWIKACGREDLLRSDTPFDITRFSNSHRVCSYHFEDHMYNNLIEKTRLLPAAQPIPFIQPNLDPLSITPADNEVLFGKSIDNIEFIVEESDEDDSLGTKSNPIIVQVSSLKATNIQHDNRNVINISVPHLQSENNVIDLDIIDVGSEEIKNEIIEIEEPHVQVITDDIAKDKTSQVPSAYEKNKVNQDQVQKNSICYVPGCDVSHQNKGKVFWFNAPLDENMRKIWDICIDRNDKRLTHQDNICHKHFSKEDIIHEVRVDNADGKTSVTSNEPKLKHGAVPCIKFHDECCVPFCKRSTGRMYCFPVARNSDFHLWLYMVKNAQLRYLKMKTLLRHRVCEIHFEPDCFDSDYLLKRTAAPTLYLPDTFIDLTTTTPLVPQVQSMLAHRGSTLLCAYMECNTKSNSNKNVFRFPVEPERCVTWLKACGREDLIKPGESVQKAISSRFGVCEDHFHLHSFDSTFDKLKSDAVPKQFVKPIIPKVRESKSFSTREKMVPSRPTEIVDILKTPTPASKVKPDTNEAQSSFTTDRCFYKGCQNKSTEGIHFFSFPTERVRFEAWLTACGQKNVSVEMKDIILKSQKICSKHFSNDIFESENKLKHFAIPVGYGKELAPTNRNEIEDSSKNDANPTVVENKSNNDTLRCAVEFCRNFYSKKTAHKSVYHKFPDPAVDQQRFKIWIKLLDNKKLFKLTDEEICERYVVCVRHFESHFYENGMRSAPLCLKAVPTLYLPGDIRWFFDSDYYKTHLLNYFKNLPVKDAKVEWFCSLNEENTIEWLQDDKNREGNKGKTVCVLEKDRISFPGTGHYLNMGKRMLRNKRKFPYAVYNHSKSGYALSNDIEVGENILIHTAIIIDDNDACERAVLQQLLDKRRKI